MWTDGKGYFYYGDCRPGDREAAAQEAADWAASIGQTPQEQLFSRLSDQIQKRLDDFARTRNYDGILSACTYATDPNPKFAVEGSYCVGVRSATWTAAYTILSQVQAGQRGMPNSITDIAADLPVLEWPNA